jgi:N-acetylglucosamine transport system substrate-binding protein
MSILVVMGISPLTVAAQTHDLPFEVAPEAINPLGVPENTKAEGVFFQGGLGIDYIKYAADLFARLHPGSEITVEGIQGVGEKLRPRFIAGNPPDVIDNSGAGNLDTTALATEGQLLDLAPLMNAPSLDTPGKTVAETLFPGSQAAFVYDGKQLAVNVAYTVFGIWYNKRLFEEKGWTYPKTWDEMLGLCETIQSSGMACWTYQGQYPQYMVFGLFEGMVYKLGGDAAWKAVDNLEPDAWRQEAIVTAANQIAQLASKGYIMEGTEALNHTESQTEWLKGKAAFIPCGTWLENEMAKTIPEGFEMVVGGAPGPGNAMMAQGGEVFLVPAQAKNPEAGMEFLRMMLSKASARFFAENVSNIMPVIGGTEGADVSSSMVSALAAVEAAGQDVFPRPSYTTWYFDFMTEVKLAMGELLSGRITPEEFIDRAQAKADETAADPDIVKFSR